MRASIVLGFKDNLPVHAFQGQKVLEKGLRYLNCKPLEDSTKTTNETPKVIDSLGVYTVRQTHDGSLG